MKVSVVKGKFSVQSVGAAARVSCNVCDKARRLAGDVKDAGDLKDGAAPSDGGATAAAGSGAESLFTPEEARMARAWLAAPLYAPDAKTVAAARALMADAPKKVAREAKKPLASLDEELKRGAHAQARRVMLIAPAVINGRPMGLQTVTCIYCGQLGLIHFESERRAPPRIAPLILNTDPHTHAKRRIRVSFTALMAIDHLARAGPSAPAPMSSARGRASRSWAGRPTGSRTRIRSSGR